MSNKITSYYLPNKIANSYVANKRTGTGEYMYDSAMQDIGMETQAAVQSLNKSYSNVINDAYTNYLNSKRSIMSSNLGQGYKEAYIEKQQEALQETTAQASLSATETKQQLLQQQYESQAAVGKAFQTEVLNMEQVGTQLTNYMEYLKNVYGEAGTSYYEDIISGKGLTDLDSKVGLKAEDIYDLLYNAQPKGYSAEGGEAAMGWMDWLKTQIKTEKEQSWYDWYVGEGGYEQFQDAYEKGSIGTVAEYHSRKNYENAKASALATYNAEKNAAQADYNAKVDKINQQADNNIQYTYPKPEFNADAYKMNDGYETEDATIRETRADLQDYVNNLGYTEDELKELGYGSVDEMVETMINISHQIDGTSKNPKVEGLNENYVNLINKVGPMKSSFWKRNEKQQRVEAIYEELMKELYRNKVYKKRGLSKEFTYDKEFSFPEYEEYIKQ